MCLTGAEVELEGGQKLTAKLVILGDGVHSKSAAKYHKMPLRVMDIVGWRYVRSAMHQLKCHALLICISLMQAKASEDSDVDTG